MSRIVSKAQTRQGKKNMISKAETKNKNRIILRKIDEHCNHNMLAELCMQMSKYITDKPVEALAKAMVTKSGP